MSLSRPSERTKQFAAPFVEIAPGAVVVAGGYGVLNFGQSHIMCEQCVGIDQHLKLLAAPAHRHDLGHAGNVEQPPPHHPVGQRADLVRVGLARFADHGNLQKLSHHRRDRREMDFGPRRQAIGGRANPLIDDLAIQVDVGTPIKLDVDHRQAHSRRAADGLHARRSIEHRFQRHGNLRFDFFRRQAGRLGHHGDPRPVKIGKHVDRQVDEHPRAIHQYGQGNQGRQQAKAKRGADDGVEHVQCGRGCGVRTAECGLRITE